MTSKLIKFVLILIIALPVFPGAAQTKQKIFRFDTPWLGVEIDKVSEKILKDMGLNNGVIIEKVYKNSPAEKAGLESDDIIVSYDGEKVASPDELSDMVKMEKAGDEVELEYFRNGKMNSTKVKIEKRKSPQIFMNKKPYMMKKKFHPAKNSVFLGVRVEPLTDQLRDYFNVSEGLGVLVSEVLEDSPAEKAGIKAGDVITKIEQREVQNYHDLLRGLNYFDPNDKVEIYFVRNKSKKSLKVVLAEPESNIEKILRIDDDDDIIDLDIKIEKLKGIDENELELNPDAFEKKVKISKEIKEKNEI